MTQFAVATWKQAVWLQRVRDGKMVSHYSRGAEAARVNGWAEYNKNIEQYSLTPSGRLALELREALGPDRRLTKAGARAIATGYCPRATKIRLMDDGLWRREYMLGRGHELAWLTEDGLNVREILLRHRVTF